MTGKVLLRQNKLCAKPR